MKSRGSVQTLFRWIGDDRKFLQRQLLGALLVSVAVWKQRILDIAAQMLRLCDLFGNSPSRLSGSVMAGRSRREDPERVDGGGHAQAHLTHHVALRACRNGVHHTGALRRLDGMFVRR